MRLTLYPCRVCYLVSAPCLHQHPRPTSQAESLNEQRYVAYWVARASLGASKAFDTAAIDSLRRSLVIRKPPQHPKPPHAPRADARPRPRSSLPRGAQREVDQALEPALLGPNAGAADGLPGTAVPAPRSKALGHVPQMQIGLGGVPVRVHPLRLQPSWRGPLDVTHLALPQWNDSAAAGLRPPKSRKLESILHEVADGRPRTARPSTAQWSAARGEAPFETRIRPSEDSAQRPATARATVPAHHRYLRHIRDAETGRPVFLQTGVYYRGQADRQEGHGTPPRLPDGAVH